MVQNVFGICEAKNGTETDELLQAGSYGHPKGVSRLRKGAAGLGSGDVIREYKSIERRE